MEKHTNTIEWAIHYLNSNKYTLKNQPEIVLETPWSNVIRLPSTKGAIYLKQPAPAVAREAEILQLMKNHFHANVPTVLAINNALHCFLMRDEGIKLRTYLKTQFQTKLLCQAIKEFTGIQRSIEKNIQPFFSLGVLDWRLDKLPKLYKHLISQIDFLKSENMTDAELKRLHELSPQIIEEFALLSQYKIPETIVQPDCNTNNILIDTSTKKLTFIDFGEIVISHPFFSLHNFLFQLTIHEGLKENDKNYQQIKNACLDQWLDLCTKEQLSQAFHLSKKLWPIYMAIVFYHFVHDVVDINAFRSFYSNNPNRIAECFLSYIRAMKV